MEPVDYLKILRNHWKVVAGLVFLAVVAAFFAAPRQASQAYTADHVLLLESSGDVGSTSRGNVHVAALWTTTGDVPLRAAALLYPDENLEDLADEAGDLAGQVEALGNLELNLVTITATASERDRAIAIANAFGAALVDFIDDQETQRREEAAEAASAEATELEARIAEINAQLNQQPPPPDAPVLQGELARIEAQLASAYATVEGAGGTVRYITMSDATTASREGSLMPSRSQAVLLTGFVAALLGFGVAIVLDRNDSRLRTKEQVERQFGLPVLAEVPLLGWRDRSKAAVVGFRHDPRVAEAHRGLRTALLLFGGSASTGGDVQSNGNGHSGSGNGALEHRPRQLVVVTSAEPGEGKTTTVANLAMAHAETGQSVLIVNWDLWRPMSLSVLGAAERPGIVDYLNDQDASLGDFVQDTSVPGVRIVTSGVRTHHPGARIETVQRLLEEARTLADVVIVDTAPILSASVSRELATLADAVVVVCRAGRTTGAAGGRVAELLERLGAPTLGVVLIGAPTFGGYYGSRSYLRRRPELDTGGDEDTPTGDDDSHPAPVSGDALSPPVTHYRADIPRAPEAGQAR